MGWRNFSDANPLLQLDSTSPSPKDQLVKDQLVKDQLVKDQLVKDQLFEAPASQL